jgi:hypothetical protein
MLHFLDIRFWEKGVQTTLADVFVKRKGIAIPVAPLASNVLTPWVVGKRRLPFERLGFDFDIETL